LRSARWKSGTVRAGRLAGLRVSYIYANLLGNEAGRAIYDGSALIASAGKMQAIGQRFSYADYYLISTVIDVDADRLAQAQTKLEVMPPTAIPAPRDWDG
jgi:hypothetical protein